MMRHLKTTFWILGLNIFLHQVVCKIFLQSYIGREIITEWFSVLIVGIYSMGLLVLSRGIQSWKEMFLVSASATTLTQFYIFVQAKLNVPPFLKSSVNENLIYFLTRDTLFLMLIFTAFFGVTFAFKFIFLKFKK